MKVLSTVIKAILVAYLVIFAVNNMQTVNLTLFFGSVPYAMPMFLFTIFVIFIGFITGVLMMVGEKLSVGSQVKQLKKQLLESQNEINRLKNITLTQGDTSAAVSPVDSPNNTSIKDVLR